MFIHWIDLFGTAVFAIAGSLAAGRKQMDLFGVVVLALATALGGGTLRDVLLGAHPIFWVADPTYVIVAVSASIVTFVAARYLRLPRQLLLLADALGLAFFTVLGTQRAEAAEAATAVCIIMGVMTGVAGGMIRDVLAGEVPLILRREIYATASLAGAVVYVGMEAIVPGPTIAPLVAMVVALALRLAAIRWNLSLPVFPSERAGGNGR